MALKKVNLGVDAALWTRVKVACAARGSQLQTFVDEALRGRLEARQNHAMMAEWGYRACEKGWNLQQMEIEFRKLYAGEEAP